MALNEALFYQPAYSGCFIDAFTLLNRRIAPDSETEAPVSFEEALRQTRLFVCTTMYQEDEMEMRKLLTAVLEVRCLLAAAIDGSDVVLQCGSDLAENCCLFEHHIYMDNGYALLHQNFANLYSDFNIFGRIRGREPSGPALRLLRVLEEVVQTYKKRSDCKSDVLVRASRPLLTSPTDITPFVRSARNERSHSGSLHLTACVLRSRCQGLIVSSSTSRTRGWSKQRRLAP